MTPRVRPVLSLGAALWLASACQGAGDGAAPPSGGFWGDEFDIAGDEGEVGWGEEDGGTEGEGRSHPYTVYEGWELYERYAGSGERTCQIIWQVVGEPAQTIPDACVGCEFLFEVSLRYDADASYDDGACADMAVDWRFVYAYAEVYGDGDALLGVGGAYFERADAAEFDGETFRYTFGSQDDQEVNYSYGVAAIW